MKYSSKSPELAARTVVPDGTVTLGFGLLHFTVLWPGRILGHPLRIGHNASDVPGARHL